MADSKYGRLFTEKDVDEIVNIATSAATLGNVLSGEDCVLTFEQEQGPLTFSEDEPLFLVRGKDKAAWETLIKYIEECERLGSPDEHIRAAQHAAGKLMAWQQINNPVVKVPD